MIKMKRKFARVEAFKFTQAMYAKKEPIPNFHDLSLTITWKDVAMPGEDADIRPVIALDIQAGHTAILSPECWILKDVETKELRVDYWTGAMMQEFTEVKE